jgi:hypothetical protein
MRSPVYIDTRKAPFKLYGFHEPFRRTPESVAKATSETVTRLHTMGPSARVRFRTDSDFIVIHAELSGNEPCGTMPVLATSSFEMYFVEDGKHVFKGSFVPSQGPGKTYVECRLKDKPVMKDVILYFPINASVSEFYIGLREGSNLEEGGKYKYETPVLFYGSSIVHGIGAGRPGMNYPSQISRLLDTNVYNLGFGGGAKGEPAIIDFIAEQKMSVFVYDYDHNAPNVQHLIDTHERFYRIIREKNPELPIVFVTAPNVYHRPALVPRREVIMGNYTRLRAEGDKNLYFIDGASFFQGIDADYCTVDGCHPNDLGFYRMAMGMLPTLKRILKL